jgi:selenium metabolism protein YedF
MAEIDCRGLACPQPVITTKQALDQLKSGEIIVIVDNSVSCNNVERFARSQGCSVEIKEKGEDFYLHIQKIGEKDKGRTARPEEKMKKVPVYINSQFLGIGDEALGKILMRSFLNTLLDQETKPCQLILINSGVHLATEGSEALETLRSLSEKGIEILSCGTCLDFYRLKEKLKVGKISNMYDIVQSLLEADHVIRP